MKINGKRIMASNRIKKNNDSMSRSAMRRQREREYRCRTILSAAESLFARDGYHQTGMEKIADKAEMSVGAVYFYFKNKEDLLVNMIEDIGDLLRRILADAFERYGASMEGFKQAGYAFFDDFCINYPEKVAIVFRESVGQGPEVEEKRKEIFDKLNRDVSIALHRASEKEGVDFSSRYAAEVITVSILGIYERVAYHYLFWKRDTENLKQIGRDAVAFILGGINNLFGENRCS